MFAFLRSMLKKVATFVWITASGREIAILAVNQQMRTRLRVV